MSAADGLVPMDDIVTARWRWCTGCGRRGGTSVGDMATLGPLAVALTLCERCRGERSGTHGVDGTAATAICVEGGMMTDQNRPEMKCNGSPVHRHGHIFQGL
jgi:hypothetical protein